MKPSCLAFLMRAIPFSVSLLVVVLTLQDARAEKRACKRDYEVPLLNAIADRNLARVKDLLAQGADPNVLHKLAYPLRLAVQGMSTTCRPLSPDRALVRLLLDAGADVTVKGRWSFIHVAAEAGDVEVLRMAVKAGAPIEARSTQDRTPLITAIAASKPDAVEFLLAAGADPNATVWTGTTEKTALHFAALIPGPANRSAKLLVEHGAKYRILEGGGPLYEIRHIVKRTGDFGELIDILVTAGGDINETGNRQKQPPLPFRPTPLNVGLLSSTLSTEVVEAMLRKGADPNNGALYALGARRDDLHPRRRELLGVLFKYGARPELTASDEGLGVMQYAEKHHPAYARELREIIDTYASGGRPRRIESGSDSLEK